MYKIKEKGNEGHPTKTLVYLPIEDTAIPQNKISYSIPF